MFQAKKQRGIKLKAVNYVKIYTKYYFNTQYRVYRPDKNRFDWPTNVKFYKDRNGLKLLLKGLLSRFDWVRADVPVINPNHTDIPSDIPGVLNNDISSDDDD